MLLKLLTAPLTAPISGFNFVLHTIQDMAERELYDPYRIRDELLALQLQLDEGELTEEEYLVREEEIMVRYREARARRQQGW